MGETTHPVGGDRRMIDGFQDGISRRGRRGGVRDRNPRFPRSKIERENGRERERQYRERETETEGGEGIERKRRTITRKMSILL
jgi:hypothetical protein